MEDVSGFHRRLMAEMMKNQEFAEEYKREYERLTRLIAHQSVPLGTVPNGTDR